MNEKRKVNFIEDYLREKNLLKSSLIKRAFTHSSRSMYNYEKLEFLGDAILDFVICEYIYNRYPKEKIGKVAKLKDYLVSNNMLFKIGKKNNIVKFLEVGSGLNKKKVAGNKRIISDIIESLIGAIYLEKGFKETKAFVEKLFSDVLKKIKIKNNFNDYKSQLQILVTKKYKENKVVYNVTKKEGKKGNEFIAIVKLNNKILGKGSGYTKKEAEQNASKQAIKNFK